MEIYRRDQRQIPWKFIEETSDRVVHSHAEANLPIIWSAAKKDIPSLKYLTEEMLEDTDTIESKKAHIDVDQIRLLILERKDEIKEKFKAEVVGIFGSCARGEEKEGSDIDTLVRFGEGASLFDLVGLGYYLKDMFGVPVDVVSERALHPMIKDDVLKELVSV
jgi:predicted nucleotidyltransferase